MKESIQLANILKGFKPNVSHMQVGAPVREYLEGRYSMWERMRDEIANFCASKDPNFNKQRWLDYIKGRKETLEK